MDKPQGATKYQDLVRRHQPPPAPPRTAEDDLDALLTGRSSSGDDAATPQPDTPMSNVERMRILMRDELLPIAEELRAKYEPAGVLIELDADNFLAGGVGVLIEVQYDIQGMRLEGTVTNDGIAFHEARFTNNVPGVITTGPMLRARNLSGQTFRQFLCERVTQLVRSAPRKRPAT